MGYPERWSVTYTKHVKQKRKVYQDGFLERQPSSNKLMLFDEAEKLLECKIVKKDEPICCGDSITFNSFIVDVNDAVGAHNFSPPQSKVEKKRNQNSNLSPTQKVIRDFKKREILKYEAIQQSKIPETAKSNVTEWEALYTSQITQKVKKYHEGFVQLSVRGSLARQASLLDSSRNNLSCRFLSKDETIEPGGTIKFNGYLVDIEETRGNNKSSEDNSSSYAKGNGTSHGHKNYGYRNNTLHKESIKTEHQQNVASSINKDSNTEPNTAEWKVLYTTQLTQKSKKFHDGFLRFAVTGSLGRQAMLLDETKTVLHSRFLRKDEVIQAGSSIKFDAYLIDVGEVEGNHTTASAALGNISNVKKTQIISRDRDSNPSKSSRFKGKCKANVFLKKDEELNSSSTKDSIDRVPTNKLLRDASQILCFLQKPRTEETTALCHTENQMTPTKGVIVSANADLDLPQEPPNPLSSVQPNQPGRPHENVDTAEITESAEFDVSYDTSTTSSKAMHTSTTYSSSQLTADRITDQNPFSGKEAKAGPDEGNAYHMPSIAELCDSAYIKNPLDDLTSPGEMDEYPSFDLGI